MLGSQTMSEGSWRVEGGPVACHRRGFRNELHCSSPAQCLACSGHFTNSTCPLLMQLPLAAVGWGGSIGCSGPPSASSQLVVSEHVSHSVGLVFSCSYKMMLASSIKLKACCILYLPYQRTFLGNLAVWWCSWNLINILLQNISDGAVCVAFG